MKRIAPCATVIKDVARKPIKKVRLGRERENVLPTIRVSRPPPQSWSAKNGYVGFVVSFKHRWIIEHYIIGETLFITSSTQPPFKVLFTTMTKIFCLLILIRLFLKNVKVESFVNAEKYSLLKNASEIGVYWRPVWVYSGLCVNNDRAKRIFGED